MVAFTCSFLPIMTFMGFWSWKVVRDMWMGLVWICEYHILPKAVPAPDPWEHIRSSIWGEVQPLDLMRKMTIPIFAQFLKHGTRQTIPQAVLVACL